MCRKTRVFTFCLLSWLAVAAGMRAHAQGCPANIGFELGNFDHWEILAGRVDSSQGVMISPSPIIEDRHRIYKNTGLGAEMDPYGGFPVNCPNGSGASIRLGNNVGGAQAEGVNYTFQIPADKKTFSLIYYYAVVMQNPNHGVSEQPKFTAKVFNVTTGQYITCSSFEYVAQSGLPGFNAANSDGSVLYKSWTPVTIKLSGYAGNTIRLEFATNDCTRGGHFGYAYVDVDENCLSPILGNIVCQNDTALNLVAPYGFQSYRWFNGDFSQLLSTGQKYQRPVIPPDNTEFAVELSPFPNQGCPDTVFTRIHYSTESIVINTPQTAVPGCINEGVDLSAMTQGVGNSPELIYSFYSDAALTHRVFDSDSITKSGTYYIKGVNEEGCFASKPVNIVVNPAPVYTSTFDNKPITRPAVLNLGDAVSAPGNTLTYWKDALATVPIADPTNISEDGTYYIKITTAAGCSTMTSVTVTFIKPLPEVPNAFSPNGDGVHDSWIISNMSYYAEATVDVYSRSGLHVFHSAGGYSKPWDGKQNGNDLPIGTYYYVIRLTRSHKPISGSITLLR